MSSSVVVYLDGNDVTNCCISGSWTRRLNRPSQATVTLPMDCGEAGTFWPDAGSRLRIDLIPDNSSTPQIVFHGFVLNCETDTDKDGGTSVYNATDPMELWNWRPVRANDCDFSKPAGEGSVGADLFLDGVYAPIIMQYALYNSINCDAGHSANQDREGTLFLDLGTFQGGSADISKSAPSDWPMTIMELFSLLASTGQVDLVITPTDPGGGIMGTVDGYAGDYGTDLSGSVSFHYGVGPHNASSVRWNRDMTAMVNKYWIYGGPRVKTASDPAGDQHWQFNIQGDDPGLPGAAGNTDPYASVIARRNLSRALYGQRMKIDIFDAVDSVDVGNLARQLWRWQWTIFSYFAAVPREIIHITPTRDTSVGDFDIGDLIGVEATADVRGGFSGAQRVYEYTVSWDEDSVMTLSEIQTSADNEF